VGSVGQPRDHNPKACYATYDLDQGVIECRRVDYSKPDLGEGGVAGPVPSRNPSGGKAASSRGRESARRLLTHESNAQPAFRYRKTRDIPLASILPLYGANECSAVEKPTELKKALKSSHFLVSAWDVSRLVSLGNAISDGHLIAYYSHLLVHPDYQGRGIGRR
jgi:hypothetical protein